MNGKEGISFREEQLLIALVTVISIVTANEWSKVIDSLFSNYFENGARWRLIYSIVLTIFAVYLIDWLISTFRNHDTPEEKIHKEMLKKNIFRY